jgi:hypothetical protein
MEPRDAADPACDADRHHGRVYRLDRLGPIVAEVGVPSPAWVDAHRDWRTWPRRTFIEVQLWSDEPVAAFLD